MIVYTCKIAGDELLSDAFPILTVKDADGNEVRETKYSQIFGRQLIC